MSDAFWIGTWIGSMIVLAVAVWFGRREEKRMKEEERKLDEELKKEKERFLEIMREAWKIPGEVRSLPKRPEEGRDKKEFMEQHRN